MNAAKLIRQFGKTHGLPAVTPPIHVTRKEGAIAVLNFILDEGLKDLDDYERIRTLKEDLERER